MCEINRIACNGQGSCGPGVTGCICDAEDRIGEYRDRIDEAYRSKGVFHSKCCGGIAILVLFVFVLTS